MAIAQLAVPSECLATNTNVSVILPPPPVPSDGFKTLWLLHGYSGCHEDWLLYTSIVRYAATRSLAVVMPAAGNSFYVNMAYGGRYWDYVSEELPRAIRSYLPVSSRREDNYVAGLSMGGYGALKLAALAPDRFAAAASLSGVVDLAAFAEAGASGRVLFSGEPPRLDLCFRKPLEDGPDDLRTVFSGRGEGLPLLRLYCGSDDFLYEQNRSFSNFLVNEGIACDLAAGPGGHEWDYWDRTIKEVVAWLPMEVVSSQ